MDIEIIVDSDVLETPPDERLETENGGSITWNLLCHTGGTIPILETINGVTTVSTGNYSLKDLTTIRDRFINGELGIKPSGYIGHENRTSATPSVGTVEDLVVVAPTNDIPFYSLYFKCLWTPEGRTDINTGRYKYVSIEAKKDSIGWLMTGFALTNEPACTPMIEVKASSIQEEINIGNSNGGYTMDQKELDILIKVLDPKLVMQALLQTPEGKEAVAEVIKENMELLGGDSEETETEDNTTESHDEKTTEETTEETTTEEETAQASSEEVGKEETAQASSIVSRVGKLFDTTVKDLRQSGFDFKSITTSTLNQAKKQAIASAINGKTLDDSITTAIKGLSITSKGMSINNTNKGNKRVEAMASSMNNLSSSSPISMALSDLGKNY